MNQFKPTLLTAGKVAWQAGLTLIVIVGGLVALLRLTFPLLSDTRPELEARLGELIQGSVTIGSMNAHWRDAYPTVILSDIRIKRDSAGDVPPLHLSVAKAELDVGASIWLRSLVLGNLQVAAPRLDLQRLPDGVITLRGLGELRKGKDAPRATGWFAGIRVLNVTVDDFRWHRREPGLETLRFRNVSMQVANSETRHRLRGQMRSADRLDEVVEVIADLSGEGSAPTDWLGAVYVNAHGIQLSPWYAALSGNPSPMVAGQGGLELWGDWDGRRFLAASARLETSGIQLDQRTQSNVDVVPDIAARLYWRRDPDGWRMDVGRLVFSHAGQGWSPGRIALLYREPVDPASSSELVVGSDYLRLQELVPLLGLLPAGKTGSIPDLGALQPEGLVRDLRVRFLTDAVDEARLTFSGRFEDVGVQAWHGVPALAGLGGRFVGTSRAGWLDLGAEGLQVIAPELFAAPLPAASVAGRLAWQREDSGWLFSGQGLNFATRELVAHARFLAGWTPGASPFLDLHLDLDRLVLPSLKDYLPTGVMSPGLAAWLDRSFIEGTARRGGIVLRGRLADFPFDEAGGRFQAVVDVEDAVLEYAPGWPRIDAMEAGLLFEGLQLRIHARKGRIHDSDIAGTRAEIPVLKPPSVLVLDGRAVGSFADVLRVAQESPLRAKLSPPLLEAQGDGGSELDISLRLPLGKGPHPGEKGIITDTDLRLKKANLYLGSLGLDIIELDGALHIGNQGTEATRISARLFDRPVRIDVATRIRPATKKLPETSDTEVRVRGGIAPRELAAGFSSPLLDRIDGEARWGATLRLPKAGESRDTPVMLHFYSNLKGVGIDLPAPIGKSPESKRELRVSARFRENTLDSIALGYGTLTKAELAFRASKGNKPEFSRGEIRLGGMRARLPGEDGLRLSGDLDALELLPWLDVFSKDAEPKDKDTVLLNAIDMQVANLAIGGFGLHKTKANLRNHEGVWRGAVESDELAGEVVIPHRLRPDDPLELDLEYLLIPERDAASNREPADPRLLPPLVVNSKRFSLAGYELGQLRLTTRRSRHGQVIEKLTLDSPHLNIDGRGAWQVKDGVQTSAFEMSVFSDDPHKALTRLGFASAIDDAKTRLELNLTWPGSPPEFALANLEGTVRIDIKEGRFKQLDPGVGRVFGLLSLQTVQRRLSLDFSDLFSRGLTFDSIKGLFTLDGGDAYTNTLRMEAPSANIEISGRAGLVSRDYDQVATVTPQLTASIPVAGAIAGGPVLGAALLLAQKVLGSEIDKITRYQYQITGSWDDPQVVKLKKNGKGNESDEESAIASSREEVAGAK